MLKYFLYVRKSTDTEDKQVRSVGDQLAVLRALAKQEELNIVEEFVEKQSAKKPGRPIFTEMLTRIEKGEAQGILCWKLDRLARNPVDGGQISWFLQRGIIQHIRTHDRSYQTSDNILMMSVEFGMANQYILDLRVNSERGTKEKIRRGEYPGFAPIGYLNDVRNKLIIVDRKKAKLVKAAFELYSKGDSRLEDIATFFAERGISTRGNKYMFRDRVKHMLSNPIYYGHFRFNGEVHEGKHEPIISKKLFDDVQYVLSERGKAFRKPNDPQVFCGLLHCGTCNMMITAEQQTKYHLNGNIHHYTYYRCTRKSKAIKCREPFVREEVLSKQLSELIQQYALPKDWEAEMLRMADEDEKQAIRSSAEQINEMKTEIQAISQRLQRLLDAYLEQDIEQEVYRTQKADLLSRKKSLEGKIDDLQLQTGTWLEPLKEWIKTASNLSDLTETTPLSLKKSSVQKIFGSNLYLKEKKVSGMAQTQWAALCAARVQALEMPSCTVVVPSTGVEPVSQPSEGRILSIELRGLGSTLALFKG